MSGWLVGLMGLVYLYVALEQSFKGAWPTAIMFYGYALGNVGLVLTVR